MLTKKISIIIVSWNVLDYLKKCIHSIFELYKNDNIEIIIIDNASSDSTSDWLNSNFPPLAKGRVGGVKIILNKQNTGFAHANNQGIVIAQGDYILLLNPDTILHKGVLENMIDFFEKHNDCGVAGCKIVNPDTTIQPSVRRFPALISQIFILLKLHHFFPNISFLSKYFAKDFDYTKTQIAEQVEGAFFMIPRKVVEKIGLLDEKFYIWFEEVDFCKRISDANMKVYYVATAVITHYGGMSFKQKFSLEKQKIFNASLIYYFQKHGRRFDVFILKILNPISLFLAWVTDKFKTPTSQT
ncbi:MAG: hypothetical protein US74_C0007G0022 [Parcubacteria group bacterium GW2011_GWA2_38_13]|nr:MAG: hypothetical protein US74_C0007G0022 [Parcubacteria group bacterium GW2011_GWA2_38_13]